MKGMKKKSRSRIVRESRHTGFMCEIEGLGGEKKRVQVEAEWHPGRVEGGKVVPPEVHLIQAFVGGEPVLRDLPGEERRMLFDWAVEHFAADGLDVEGLRG